MKFFLPDSRDTVDPTFDFVRESRSPDRIQRDDLYCHEILGRCYDGVLLSYHTIQAGVYAAAARRRLLRVGAQEFYRLPAGVDVMGDCGAFSYVKEPKPTYSVDEVALFYATIKADYGISVDHIVREYVDIDGLFGAPFPAAKHRYDLTLELARCFLAASKRYSYEPLGAVHGWSPASYAAAAVKLQDMGYRYLALGGLVRLRTDQVARVLAAVSAELRPGTKLHMLGVARADQIGAYASAGVTSIDSTSPLRQAWLDKRKNYHLGGERFAALRIPDSNSARVQKRILSGEIDQTKLIRLEAEALTSVDGYAHGRRSLVSALEALDEYQQLHSPGDDRHADYERTLAARPWERCGCQICMDLGHHVVIFRGAERNRRRGFHNISQFYRSFLREIGEPDLLVVGCGSKKQKGFAPARDMYIGSLAKAQWRIADRYRAPVAILSAKYGLLHPDRVIETYDETLDDPEVRRAWELRVADQVKAAVPQTGRVVALAGAKYLGWTKHVGCISVELPLANMPMGRRLELAAGTPEPAPARPPRTGNPIAWDFFWTTFRSSLKGQEFVDYWTREGARTARMQLPCDAPLSEAIAAAREAGLFGKGTTLSGVFEVQNDLGIYWAPEGFLNIANVRPHRVRFISWEEAEAAESRGEDHLDNHTLGVTLADVTA